MNGPNNPIGWCDYTWNPITGCLHGCRFGPHQTPCYAEVLAERFRGTKAFPQGFTPAFHPERLRRPQKVTDPARVFCCSMSDLFGAWVPPAWIEQTYAAIRQAPQHSFLCLTKAPWVAAKFHETHDVPENVWLGATVTGGLANEKVRLDLVRQYPSRVRFLSVEPLEGPVDVARAEPDWIIIGAATGWRAVQPDPRWVEAIEAWADRHGVPIYHKENLASRQGARQLAWPAGHSAAVRPWGVPARGPSHQTPRSSHARGQTPSTAGG